MPIALGVPTGSGYRVTFDQSPDFDLATPAIGTFPEPPSAPPPRRQSPPQDDQLQHRRDDEALMARVAEGDVAAFTRLVERHSPRLYRVACRMLNNAQEAEDAVQDAFTRLWQSAPTWNARGGGLGAWLHRVVVNRCLDRLRQFRVVPVGDDLPDVVDDTPGPERALAVQRLGLAVEEALGSLPGRHRAAIVLCYFEGLSNIMAAQVLELNLKAMESLLFRARRGLRERLEERGVHSEDLELLQ
jgi:RNA polymerase sigma-70 factor, ECF subfamily